MDKIKMVVTDLDGTLFYDREHIAEPDRAALAALKEQGTMLVLATGRELDGTRPAIDHLKLWEYPRYIIHSGGSGIFDVKTGENKIRGLLTSEMLFKVYDLYKEGPLSCLVVKDGVIYTNKLTDDLRYEAELLRYEPREVTNFYDALREPICKFMLHGSFEDLEAILPTVTSDPDPRYHFYRSHDHYIDCTAAGMDKGSALRELCEALSIPLSETLAVGDNLNDIELLQTAGFSACPGDGHPSILSLVDYVACPAHLGAFADACGNYVLR